MIWFIIIPAALFGFFMLNRGNLYRNFFSEEHLEELSQVIRELFQENIGRTEPINLNNPPPHRTTRSGLLVAFSIRPQEQQHILHLSLSYSGGWFAAIAAGIFIAYLRRILNLPTTYSVLGVSNNGVYHAEWIVPSLPEISQQKPLEHYQSATEEGRQLSSSLTNRLDI